MGLISGIPNKFPNNSALVQRLDASDVRLGVSHLLEGPEDQSARAGRERLYDVGEQNVAHNVPFRSGCPS